MSYDSVITAISGLVSRYKLDDSSGTLVDSVGGQTASVSGTPSFSQTPLVADSGTAIQTTSSSYIIIPVTVMSTAQVAGSMVLWYATTNTGATVFDLSSASSTKRIVLIMNGTNPQIILGATTQTITTVLSTSLRDGNPHMFALTTDGTNADFFIDGVKVKSWIQSFIMGNAFSAPFWLGHRGSGGSINAGKFDENAWFTSKVSDANITALWNAGIGGAVTATAAKTISITTAAAGVLGVSTGAAKTVSIAVTTAARLGLAGTAARTISITTATAYALGLHGTAASTISVDVDAEGVVTAPGHGDVDAELTLTSTAAGAVGVNAGASRTISITATTAAVLGLTASAAPVIGIAVTETHHIHSDGDIEQALSTTINITTVAVGLVQVPAETQLTFGSGGRRRDGIGTTGFEEAEAPPPWSVATSIRRMAAHSIDDFTVSGPRPSDVEVTYRTRIATQGHYRVLVGGKDVTYFRGVPTPEPTWQLLSPGLYGPGALTFPQIKAAWERPGHGDLTWLQKWAKVVYKVKTGDDWNVIYRGFITDDDRSGADYSVTLGGELSGPAATMYRPPRVYTYKRDISALVAGMVNKLHLDVRTPDSTGIVLVDTGGQSQWDWLSQTLADSTTFGGNQWTVMPDADGRYRLKRKDTDTVHWTVYLDDAHAHPDLRRDYTEEDNRVFADAVDPDGLRITYAVLPGLSGDSGKPDYPMAGGIDMPPGTTDADTISGAGVTAMIWRLFLLGYLDEKHDLWDDEVTRAVARAQRASDLEIFSPGTVNPATWTALWDGDQTGYAMRGTHIEPAAQTRAVHKYRRNATGQIVGFNPHYDRSAKIVDRIVHMGVGKTQGQVTDWAQNSLDDGSPNYVGTIDLPMGAVINGEHHPGDPFTASMLRDARLIRPNQNIYLANFDGGTLVHITGVSYSGAVQLTVDTRARDTQEVWDVIDRNRASRASLGRVWIKDNLSSGTTRDQMAVWDKFGGIVDDTWHLDGHAWTIIPVRAGREGQVRNLHIQLLDDPPEFAMAVFGRHITPARLNQFIGNALTEDGRRNWRRHSEKLTQDHVMIYSAGNDQNPLGYHPTTKADATADFPGKTTVECITGEWRDDGGFAYHTFGEPVIWMAFYPDRDCILEPGRLFRVQLSDQV